MQCRCPAARAAGAWRWLALDGLAWSTCPCVLMSRAVCAQACCGCVPFKTRRLNTFVLFQHDVMLLLYHMTAAKDRN
jgi:hypothetical protein